jgi:hypothetical protein|tara:strand:+ start:10153 stop:10434 length:282 start_codon:yes stop_codon:yes gene_type:complete
MPLQIPEKDTNEELWSGFSLKWLMLISITAAVCSIIFAGNTLDRVTLLFNEQLAYVKAGQGFLVCVMGISALLFGWLAITTFIKATSLLLKAK